MPDRLERKRCPHCGAICDAEECQCDREVCSSFTRRRPEEVYVDDRFRY